MYYIFSMIVRKKILYNRFNSPSIRVKDSVKSIHALIRQKWQFVSIMIKETPFNHARSRIYLR